MSTEGVAAEPVVEVEPAILEVPQTLAEHREAFPATNRPQPLTAPKVEPDADKRPRHRAKSQQATPGDVDEIAALTRRLREAEDSLGIEKKPEESDRAFQLRRRVEAAELAKTQRAAATAAPVATTPPVVAPVPPNGHGPQFTEKEPTLEQFADKPDPYMAWQRELARYDRRKDTFDQQQAEVRSRGELSQKQAAEEFAAYVGKEQTAHAGRLGTYITAHPDAKALFDAEAAKPVDQQIALPIAVRAAIELHPQGPQFIHELLKAPDFADDLFLLTNNKPIGDPRTDPLVAVVRRRLLQRVQAASVGSAAPRQTTVGPRPPNPARTVPQTPREPTSDAPAGTLAEHRQRFRRV